MTDTKPSAAAHTLNLGGDLTINRLGYGTMQLTGKGIWGPPRDETEAIRVLRRAVELGVNFIDTADSYGPNVAEPLIAKALKPYARDVVIATKGGFTRQGPDQWTPLGRPDYLRQQVEMSLRSLQIDRIDLYQLHRIDPSLPLEDQLGELKKLQDEGKIRHIGLSEVTIGDVIAAQKIVPIVSVQNLFNLTNRSAEELLDWSTERGIAFIPWFPLATGSLVNSGSPLAALAARKNVSPSQLALAWLLKRSPSMVPIPGTSSVAHLEDNIRGQAIELNEDEFTELSSIS